MPIDKFDTDNYRREQIEKFVKLARLAKARGLNEKPFGMRGVKITVWKYYILHRMNLMRNTNIL